MRPHFEPSYKSIYASVFSAFALLAIVPTTQAQTASDGIAKYREMIADGNPAELYEAAGEELWKKPMGPKNATLEQCDLGLGPGVVVGAAAQLPRYFKDSNRVQDLESRLMTVEKNCKVLILKLPLMRHFRWALKKRWKH